MVKEKSLTGGVIVTLIFIFCFFFYKYSMDLFLDFYQIEEVNERIDLGDFTVSKFYIYMFVVSIAMNNLYKLFHIKIIFDSIFNNSILRDPDY